MPMPLIFDQQIVMYLQLCMNKNYQKYMFDKKNVTCIQCLNEWKLLGK